MNPERVFLNCKNHYLKLQSIFIVITRTTLRTLHIKLSSTTCFDRFWPSLGRLYNTIHGKGYRGWGLPFTFNILKYIKFRLLFPTRE